MTDKIITIFMIVIIIGILFSIFSGIWDRSKEPKKEEEKSNSIEYITLGDNLWAYQKSLDWCKDGYGFHIQCENCNRYTSVWIKYQWPVDKIIDEVICCHCKCSVKGE